jgi:hypothetical protein
MQIFIGLFFKYIWYNYKCQQKEENKARKLNSRAQDL